MLRACVLLLFAVPASAGPLGIEQIIQAALRNDPGLGAALARGDKAESEKDLALAALLPHVEARAAGQNWSYATPLSPLGRQRPDHQGLIELKAEQTLFQGGAAWQDFSRSKSATRSTRFLALNRREELLHQASRGVYAYLESREALSQASAEWERRKAHLRITRVRFQAGSAGEAQAARAESEEKAAEAARAEATSAFAEARLRLETLTGLSLEDGLLAPTPLPDPVEDPETISRRASLEHPQVLASRESQLAAVAAKKSALGRHFPSLVLGGAWRRFDESPRTFQFLRSEGLGSLEMRWALFAGGANSAAQRSAEAVSRESAQNLRAVSDEKKLLTRISRHALISAAARMGAEEARLKSSQVAYERTVKRHEAGLDSTLERLDAETALRDAEAGSRRARYARETALLDLYLAAGLLEKTLTFSAK